MGSAAVASETAAPAALDWISLACMLVPTIVVLYMVQGREAHPETRLVYQGLNAAPMVEKAEAGVIRQSSLGRGLSLDGTSARAMRLEK